MSGAELTTRQQNEVRHGELLAGDGAEAAWGWSGRAGESRARRRAALVVEAARLNPDADVLELGCGAGGFTAKFAKSGATITAVDLSPDLLTIAEGRDDCRGVRFLLGAFESIDFGGMTFDAVVGSSVLHHLDVDIALRRAFELLRPGGRLAFAEPNLRNPQIWLERKYAGTRWFPYVSPDEIAFVRPRIRRQLERHGFTEVRAEPFDWLHPGTPSALVPVVRGTGLLLERIPLVRQFAGSLIISGRKPMPAAESQD